MASTSQQEATPARVAQTATQADALPKGGTVLIGIFGAKDTPEALVRTSSGRVRRIKRGSRISAGEVLAIDAKGLILQRAGKTQRLEMPGS